MNENILVQQFINELDAETQASRNCVARMPESLYNYKPHEKSMVTSALVLLVAEIPLWIHTMIEVNEIDFVTFKHFAAKTTAEMVAHFDENIKKAKVSLSKLNDKDLDKIFALKANGQLLMSDTLRNSISSTLNHWIHHRGQLTIYLRLNNLPVPSIYGPSADDGGF